jgi:hypothetical protein
LTSLLCYAIILVTLLKGSDFVSKVKPRRKHKERKTVKACFECDHCIYCGEGDHLCDEYEEMVTVDWEPTDYFYRCCGTKFIER